MPETDDQFSLSAIVNEVIAECRGAGPAVIAEAVLRRIPREHFKGVLEITLREYVTARMRHDRNVPVAPAVVDIAPKIAAREEKAFAELVSTAGRTRGRSPSARVRAMQEIAELRTRMIHVAPGSGADSWKELDLCGPAEFEFAGNERQKIIDGNSVWRDRYFRMRDTLLERGLELTKDLPDDELREAWGNTAEAVESERAA